MCSDIKIEKPHEQDQDGIKTETAYKQDWDGTLATNGYNTNPIHKYIYLW